MRYMYYRSIGKFKVAMKLKYLEIKLSQKLLTLPVLEGSTERKMFLISGQLDLKVEAGEKPQPT